MFITIPGPIPPELGRLDALTTLHLGGNELSGKGDVRAASPCKLPS